MAIGARVGRRENRLADKLELLSSISIFQDLNPDEMKELDR